MRNVKSAIALVVLAFVMVVVSGFVYICMRDTQRERESNKEEGRKKETKKDRQNKNERKRERCREGKREGRERCNDGNQGRGECGGAAAEQPVHEK